MTRCPRCGNPIEASPGEGTIACSHCNARLKRPPRQSPIIKPSTPLISHSVEAREDPGRLYTKDVLVGVGILLLLVGAGVLLYFWVGYDVGVDVGDPYWDSDHAAIRRETKVANIDLLNRRQNGVIVGALTAFAGLILIGFGATMSTKG